MQSVVTRAAPSFAGHLTTVIGTAVAMLALSWQLTLLSLVVVPVSVWLARRVAKLRQEIIATKQCRKAEMLVLVDEGLSASGIRLSKTLGASRTTSARFAETSRQLIDLEMRSEIAGQWRSATMSVIYASIPALVYLAAGFPTTSGGMTMGTLVAFTALQASVYQPLIGLMDVSISVVSSKALFSRVFGYLDLHAELPSPASPVAVDLDEVRGEVRIEGVSYRYPEAEEDALDGVDLLVPAGSSLALVGGSGCGKSTLSSLVPRLRDPSQGRVLVDGVDLRDVSFDDLSRIVGVVSQDPYLLHASIRDNLLYAKPEATEAELWRALEAAQVGDLVAALPQGLDTVVGASGQRFSGGEKQRLAIARTLLRDPKVLVLDEATSALDTTTERELQTALDELARGRTTITVAHRMATVRNADQIAVLSDGRIVEHGTHADLLGHGGRYAALAGAGTPTPEFAAA